MNLGDVGLYRILVGIIAVLSAGCATLTEEAMTPIMLSFSDGSGGSCSLENKRGAWSVEMPGTVSVRKSDVKVRKFGSE